MRRRSMIAGVVPCVRPLVVSSGPRDFPFYPLYPNQTPSLAVVLELNLGLRLKPKPDNLTRAPPTRALRSEHIGRRLDISATPWRGFTSIREVSRRRGAEGERRSMPKTFAKNISATIFVKYPCEIEAPKRQLRWGSDLGSYCPRNS